MRTRLFLVLFFVACLNFSMVGQLLPKSTTNYVELGTIGNTKKEVLTKKNITATIPMYKQKMRIGVTILPFTKTSFNKYKKAAAKQNKRASETFIDSIAIKTKYAQLQLMDKVQLIKELNADYNTTTSTYLQQSKENELVIQVSAFFDGIDLSNLSQAEEVYLLNNKPQKYVLELVKGGKAFAHIDLSKGVTFGFSTASFCWKKEHGIISLVNLISNGESCAKDTYKKVRRLDKKVNYFKM